MNRSLRYGLFLVAAITGVNLSFSLLFRVIARELPESQLLRLFAIVAAAALSAVVITAIVVVSSPVLRDWLLTYRRLSRLENISHPLLVRLSKEAPGTYHHTMLVSDLAAKAAKAIGADARLARIAGYFHDIGKLISPAHFVENQRGKNPHDTLNDPEKSAQLIIGHVKEGIQLARQHGLPPELIDAIVQHHGTLLLKQFYEEAKAKNLPIKATRFRYPGPRPLSKEAALLMLADNAEARVRALPRKSPPEIRQAVEEAITERYREKQLDLSGLSSRDLERIRDVFTDTFAALHHRRLPPSTHVSHYSDHP
jgi:putative nucleotidyltransferase with HDIG domain